MLQSHFISFAGYIKIYTFFFEPLFLIEYVPYSNLRLKLPDQFDGKEVDRVSVVFTFEGHCKGSPTWSISAYPTSRYS